jgi:predicted nucleic acid-binding protein
VNSKIAVGDADSLVALADREDANNKRAVKTGEWLLSMGYEIIYPNTAILEAITALKRAKNLPDKATLIARQYLAGAFAVEFVGEMIQWRAAQRFTKTDSKQDTIFDCVVAETADELKADFIFSFDDFYPKQGFQLADVPEK